MVDLTWSQSWNDSFKSSASTQMKIMERDFQTVRKNVADIDRKIALIDRSLASERTSSRGRSIGFDRLPSYRNALKKDLDRSEDAAEKARTLIKKELEEEQEDRRKILDNVQNPKVSQSIENIIGNIKDNDSINKSKDKRAIQLRLDGFFDELDVKLKNKDTFTAASSKLYILSMLEEQLKEHPHIEFLKGQFNLHQKKAVGELGITSDYNTIRSHYDSMLGKLDESGKPEISDDDIDTVLNDERLQIRYLGTPVEGYNPEAKRRFEMVDNEIFQRFLVGTGARASINIPESTQPVESLQQFMNGIVPNGYVVDENKQISINPEATEEVQKEAAEKIGIDLNKSISYNEFEEAVLGLGVQPGRETRRERRLLAQKRSLLERRKKTVDSFAQNKRLSKDQAKLLDHSILRITGFRESLGVSLGEDTPEVTVEDPVAVEDPTEVDDSSTETTGVPIIPAVINRVTKAYERATTADDNEKDQTHTELTNVVEDFKSLPEDIQSRFPSTFLTGIYEFNQPREGKSDSPEAQQQGFENAIRSLDDTGITTETVSQYVATTDSVKDTGELLSFLNHPDSVAEGSDIVGRKQPLGTIGSDFLNTLDMIAQDEASSSDLIDVFSRAKSFNQSNDPQAFEIPTLTNKYGQYDSIDRFVNKMDAGRGERVAPPSETEERDDKIAGEAEASRLFADLETQDVDAEQDESEINRQAIATATRGSESSLRSPREVQLAAAAEKVAQEKDFEAILAAQDAERKARSERPAIIGTDDTPADRVLRESLSDPSALTVGATPSADQQILSDEDKRKMDIAEFDSRPGQAPSGTVFRASAGSTVTPIETIAPEGEAVSEEEMPPAQRQKLDERIEKANQEDPIDSEVVDAPPPPTPDEQLANVRKSLPKGRTPRIDPSSIAVDAVQTSDEDAVSIAEQNRKETRRSQTRAVRLAIEDLKSDMSKGIINYEQSIAAADNISNLFDDYASSPNFDIKMRNIVNSQFDKKEEELRVPFVSPTKDNVITSAETMRGSTPHEGIDLRARLGDPIMSIADGVVIAVNNDETLGGKHTANELVDGEYTGTGPGKFVFVLHKDGRITKMMHLSDTKVAKGDRVKAGQVIGLAGNTGNSKGSHLHLEVHVKSDDPNVGKNISGVKSKYVVSDPIAEYPSVFKQFTLKKLLTADLDFPKPNQAMTIERVPEFRERLGMKIPLELEKIEVQETR
ncbi:MAG: hypothetical protein CMN21_00045 [Rubinisphaera sp.]|uniref:M23 family metallopeptidase n=1 Tax=Rubinisphaera sp. TaxID=2024857 RepID=UPI000C0EFE5C|nr:M23 family metallopeptidase [Rubinisphaera sp.]MBV07590.1 hypothetical protein [Rubinisphaera sp.]